MQELTVDNDKIRALLWQRQRAVAEKADLHPDTLARKIKGQNGWTIEDLNKLAKAGGFDVSEIVRIGNG
jgi:hypothetical protein|tara:strand:+ start:805 stop:1011 length:207 start_codon:yes stop_codon:yes gene_type:complete